MRKKPNATILEWMFRNIILVASNTISAQVITLIWLYFTSLVLHTYSTIFFRMNRFSPQIYCTTSRFSYNRALIDRGYASIWLDSKT